MDEKLKEAIALCQEFDLIHEIKLRDFKIRNEFWLLRGRGYRSTPIIKFLMDKHNLGWSRMNTITYNYAKGKKRRRRMKERKEAISQNQNF